MQEEPQSGATQCIPRERRRREEHLVPDEERQSDIGLRVRPAAVQLLDRLSTDTVATVATLTRCTYKSHRTSFWMLQRNRLSCSAIHSYGETQG